MMDELGQAATVGVSSSWWAGSQTEYPTNCGYCSVQLKGARESAGGSCRIHGLTRYVEGISKINQKSSLRVSGCSCQSSPKSW